MITVAGLSKGYGAKSLFSGVTLQLNAGSRYGVVGANGSGKSTFLNILGGADSASDGSISYPKHTTIGMLDQDRFGTAGQSIVSVAMSGDEVTFAALQELEALTQSDTPNALRQGELSERISVRNGYALQARAGQVLSGLGIPAALQHNPLSSLSGGYQLRVLLARVLVGNPDILLLDEPTNHLDIMSIRWLEDFLAGYRGCLLVVSHDHSFLNRVCNHTLDVDFETVTPYVGNYESFLSQRDLIVEQKKKEIERAEKLIAEKKAFVERFGAKASKAKQAQSRAKQIEKIEVAVLKPSSRRSPAFSFPIVRQSGKEVVTVSDLSMVYGEKRVLSSVGFKLRRGERLGIVGVNGAGKSTLLRILAGQQEPTAGRVTWGHETHRGYFPQDHSELLTDPKQTALDALWGECPRETPSFVRSHLGKVLFSGSDADKKIQNLSGGETARLIFGKVIVKQPNVLLLDEPTNHLDFESIDALTDALAQYDGTLILVSHNRWFVSKLCTRIIEVTLDGLREFSGGYEQYLNYFGVDLLDRKKGAEHERQREKNDREQQKNTLETGSDSLSQAMSWEEQKKLKNRLKALPKLQAQSEQAIEAAEERKSSLQENYAKPGFFDSCSPEELLQLREQEAKLTTELETLMGTWEALGEEEEKLTEQLAQASE